MLDHYWRDRPSDAVKEEIMGDWMAALEAFSRDEVMAACREWARDETRKPKPADIRGIVLRERAKAIASQPKPPEPEREKVTPEAAASILAKAGFKPKVMP